MTRAQSSSILASAIALLALAVPAHAQVVNFDDLVAPQQPLGVYMGFNWHFIDVFSDDYGYGAHSSSPNNYAYVYCCPTAFPNPSITAVGGGSFDFTSAFVETLSGSTQTYNVFGYDNANNLIYTQAVTVGPVGHTEVFDFVDVSKVVFGSNDADNMTLDDVDFNPVPSTSSTPEPGSLVLLATGLFGVAGVVQRRRRAQTGTD